MTDAQDRLTDGVTVACFRCGGSIVPNGHDPVEVILRPNSHEGQQVLWAHGACLGEMASLGTPILMDPDGSLASACVTATGDNATDEFLERFGENIIGRPVVDRLLAGNSVSVFVTDEHGARWTIWMDPPWRLEGPQGVLAGSRQAQDETSAGGWSAVGEALDRLLGQTLELVVLDGQSRDLVLQFSGALRLRTFANDPRDSDSWRITEKGPGRGVEGGPTGVRLFTLSRGRTQT